MHRNEAIWIAAWLKKQPQDSLSPLLNLGSSTSHFRTIEQPFIENLIFQPLQTRSITVIHSDIKEAQGVDQAGDITMPEFRDHLKQQRVNTILCSNMSEHIEQVKEITGSIVEILLPEGYIIVTVPYRYPIHMDPIDTNFRPSPKEIHSLFPGTTIIESAILDVGTVGTSLLKTPLTLLKMFIRLFLPFWRLPGWITVYNKFLWFFRNRSISCVILKKLD